MIQDLKSAVGRISDAYGIPSTLVSALSTAGLLAFGIIYGVVTYSVLVTLWAEIPTLLAISLAVLIPPVTLLAAITGMTLYEAVTSDTRRPIRATLVVVGWFIVSGMIAYLVRVFLP